MTSRHRDRARWPVLAAAFASGLAVSLLLPRPPGADARDQSSERVAAEAAAPAERPAGPTVTQDGRLPAGFARTEAGAVAAAASFVCSGQALLGMDPLTVERALQHVSAEAAANELVARHLDQIEAVRKVLASGTGPTEYRQSAMAWRLEAFDEDRARVAIWSVGVLSRDGAAPPQAAWSTSVVDLVWERDDWRVWGETIEPGPTPILDDSDAPATSQELTTELTGFTPFGARP